MSEITTGKITDLQKTKKGRYSVFVDDQFYYSIDGETLLKSEIRVGKELTYDYLAQVQQESDLYKAREKAYDLLSYRPLSAGELVDKLKRSFPVEICVQVAKQMQSIGLVEDGEYAKKLALELYEYKHLSANFIRQELYKKSIGRELCEQILSLYEFDDSASIAALLQGKYAAKLKTDPKKVIAALQRRGFSYRDIMGQINTGEQDEY